MHPNADTITKFYAAFARLDADTMAQCYAPDVAFDDEVFSLRGKEATMGMWRMLCEATRARGLPDWKLEYSGIEADATSGRAHWDAHYRFSATGRLVLNRIDAAFTFNPQGLIATHRDRFDFWAWSRQALGTPGLLLGWTPLLRNKVRATAAANLAKFNAARGAVMGWFEGFESRSFALKESTAFARFGGNRSKPALLLLHGFPQTHVLWHRVAQALKDDFFIVMPDLRGYGDSSHAPGLPDHSNYSKRAMAQDAVDLMGALGVDRFYLCGHDRGGRVAHRLALDHAARVQKLCVIDIAPTLDMYDATNLLFATYYYHWFHLIQPSPLPEMMIGPNARQYLHAKLGGWGSAGLNYIEPQALAEYERCFCRDEAIHTACEDYRASAGIDLAHDREGRSRGDKVACDIHVLWGERGVVHKLFKPLDLWQAQCAGRVTGQAVAAGHFIPEELHAQTAQALAGFFR